MNNIQMVDLKRQYIKIKHEIDIAINQVIESTNFINGPEVGKFSDELAQYLGIKHVIPCANGTDALQIALMALGLKPGDEVITPSFTYIATVEVVALLGLKPIFIDVDSDTFTINIESLRGQISSKTKAIIPVHLYGQSANMEEILAIANEFGIPVIEDDAQALGGTYIFKDGRTLKNGVMGDIGCTSFFPSKNLGCYGDGGAIFTNNDDLASKIKMIANHGQSKKYYHEVVGCNSRLDTIQAAILSIKLKQLDHYCNSRIKVADFYDSAFKNISEITTPYRVSYSKHVFHQYTIKLNGVNRDKFQLNLAEKGVPSMIYYPVPSHKQNMFKTIGVNSFNLPNTDYLQNCVISLPIHTELTNEELNFITSGVIESINELK